MLTRPLALVFASSFGFSTSFYLMLSVVPLYAASVGAGGAGPVLATGALMLSTVAAELVTPLLVSRFGYRAAFAAGLVLLGAPAFVLGTVPTVAGILAVCLARGLRLGIVLVVGGALVAELVPPERRGEGLGLYGVAVGVPFVVALPLGVWLATNFGYAPVFVTGGLAALAGLPMILGLPGKASSSGRPVGVLAALRTPALLGPLAVFFVVAIAAGIVVTFVPLAMTGVSGNLAVVALLVQASAATVFRWWSGRRAGRDGYLRGGMGRLPERHPGADARKGFVFRVRDGERPVVRRLRRWARAGRCRVRGGGRADRLPGGLRAHRRAGSRHGAARPARSRACPRDDCHAGPTTIFITGRPAPFLRYRAPARQ
jgi:MFS family permease